MWKPCNERVRVAVPGRRRWRTGALGSVLLVASCTGMPGPSEVTMDLPACYSESCGGRRMNAWVALPMDRGTEPRFTALVERNGQALPPVSETVLWAFGCDTMDNKFVGLCSYTSASESFAKCNGVPQVEFTACLDVVVWEASGPLVDGDTYHVVIEDEAGRRLVDERWTATYVDSQPAAGTCIGPETVQCRNSTHSLTPLPVGVLDGGALDAGPLDGGLLDGGLLEGGQLDGG